MDKLQPIYVSHLFRPERNELLNLLRGLSRDQWDLPTACDGWTVKDVSLHLLGGDIGIISRKRDQFAVPLPAGNSFADAINRHNGIWLDATRRLSTTILIDLLDHVGSQAILTFEGLDPDETGGPVTWAGPDPAPVWLDVAREYTERWHHQQHIRDAVDRPGLMDRTFAGPVFDTFVRALPWSFRDVVAEPGTRLDLRITGDAGDQWVLKRSSVSWALGDGQSAAASAVIELSADTAWRMFTNGLTARECEARATISGDRGLARMLFASRAIIV